MKKKISIIALCVAVAGVIAYFPIKTALGGNDVMSQWGKILSDDSKNETSGSKGKFRISTDGPAAQTYSASDEIFECGKDILITKREIEVSKAFYMLKGESEKTAEKEAVKYMEELEAGKTILESYPRRLVFELTNACNLNCIMCGRNAADFKPTVFDMDVFRSFEPLMDIVEEVTLMGWGEPTIHPNFIEMLEIINKHSARKYFCSNGMNLKKIKNAIFDYNVDVFAVSLDGATDETNSRIRRGSKIDQITEDLKDIVRIKKERGLNYPWINFVFCAIFQTYNISAMFIKC